MLKKSAHIVQDPQKPLSLLAFARRVSSGEFLLSNTFTRCEEQSKGYRLVVGGFDPRGLYVSFSSSFDGGIFNGVVGVLPCGSSLASGT